jgi:glycerol-3-phosphate dehydrogenase subunit B
LAQTLGEAGKGFFKSVAAAEISLPFLKSGHSLSPFEIAQSLDREDGREAFRVLLKQALGEKNHNHVLMPPVLGMIHHDEILETLQKSTGRTLAEISASLPSVPGWRLAEAILRYFKSQGYDILEAQAVGFENSGGRVKALQRHHGSERLRFGVGNTLLATGKFWAGGIQDRGGLREGVFGLPLFLQGRPLGQWSRRDLFTPRFQEVQPLFSAGVRINGAAQALGGQGEVLYENLFACGRVLSGANVGGDRSSAAISLISGSVAGENCR